ncbi:Lipoprotein [Flavobacterium branchiophilum]|uniref:Uncharacterized protein n=1 Tax=Flavobacterium branchiophilum (strain FL-15) TaxID=1034807 RepID=G2Z2P6_FLABF|nr:hypothetical protein [Flavobacterium branchiophilum]CCB70220.1 Hypothetical protein FBFL15_2200 [Flavobacterium branchiophilum FL-15]
MRNILIFIFSLSVLNCYSQKKDLTITATSNSESEVVIRIINNTSKKKYLFLDVKNLGVFYQSKKTFTNINSSKMYLDFLELNGHKSFIPVSTFNNYNSGIKDEEDFKSKIKNNTILFLPNEEKRFVINLYKQDESDYLKAYKVLPSRYYKVSLKICGNQIKEKIKNTNINEQEFRNIISKYDFNDYQSNVFRLKIKTIKSPPPPPLQPSKKYSKYSFKELMMMK